MSWTNFHPFIQEATLTTFAVGLLVLLVLVIRKPFAKRYGAKAAYLLWALPLARFVTPPLPGNWSLAGLLGFSRPAPTQDVASEPSVFFTHEATRVPAEIVWATPVESAELGAVPPALPTFEELSVTTSPAIEVAAPATTSLLEATLAQAPLILTCVWI
ncbi:MAG: hypothetical protein AAF331_16170, partial [Pseudomonadota bacterium]